jgi:hypothetical protein
MSMPLSFAEPQSVMCESSGYPPEGRIVAGVFELRWLAGPL